MRRVLYQLLTLALVVTAMAAENRDRQGDSCDDAYEIVMLPYSNSETTTDNSNTYGNPAPDEWYEFFLPAEGNVYMSLCQADFDTYLRLLTGSCSTELASNDDACGGSLQSELDAFLQPGTYKICVEGYSSNSGSYTLEVSSDVPTQGNDCLNPFLIEEFPYSHEWVTSGYADTGFEPSPDVYYHFLLEEDGLYSFTTCREETYAGYFDTRLLILAEDCQSVVYANDNDCDLAYANWSTITTCLAQGLYYLVIEGHGTESGNYILDCVYLGECDPMAVEEATEPSEYSLSQNHPNPFNPSTTIAFSLPLAGVVDLAVYDLAGRRVALLAAGAYTAGRHEVEFDATGLSSGLYFYRLTAGKFVETRKMVVVK